MHLFTTCQNDEDIWNKDCLYICMCCHRATVSSPSFPQLLIKSCHEHWLLHHHHTPQPTKSSYQCYDCLLSRLYVYLLINTIHLCSSYLHAITSRWSWQSHVSFLTLGRQIAQFNLHNNKLFKSAETQLNLREQTHFMSRERESSIYFFYFCYLTLSGEILPCTLLWQSEQH